MGASAILDRVRTLLETTPPFDVLPADVREDLLADVELQFFAAGEVIVEQSAGSHPGLYIVEAGLVRLLDTVQQRLLNKVGEGETFGSFGLIKGGVSIYEAKAVEATVCAVLRAERFQKLYDQYDDFASFFDQDIRLYVRRIGAAVDVTGAHLLFSRNLSLFDYREPVTCEPDLPARQAARLMGRHGVDALLVVQEGEPIGLLSVDDLRDRLVARGLPADTPVRRLLSAPIPTVPSDASIYDVIVRMLSQKVSRLVLVDADRRTPIGIVTDRDISHFRGLDPLATVARIDAAASVSELATIRDRVSEQLLSLARQGARPEMLNRIMMELYDRLVVRVLTLAERELRAAFPDEAVEVPWAWIRLGSGGRREMALNSEQHNALVYADPASAEQGVRADRWLDRVAEWANDALERCGFRPSEIVARDPRWRQSVGAWKKAYNGWILRPQEGGFSGLPLFFDLRAVYGDERLVEALRADIVETLRSRAKKEGQLFLRALAARALEKRPAFPLLRRVVERVGDPRSFDVRESGIVPIVDAARVLALEIRYLESTNTYDRLRAAARAIPDLERTIEDALQAYQYLVDFRLESQLRAVEAGDPPVNQIDAATLTKIQRRLLRNAIGRAGELQEAIARRYDTPRKRFPDFGF